MNTDDDFRFKAEEREKWDGAWKLTDQTVRIGNIDEYWDMVKLEFLLNLLPKTMRCLTLECGCGAATISTWLSELGHETIAVDFSKEALRVARNNFKVIGTSGNFTICDVEHLPFKDNVFDVVMSFGLFEHFADPRPHTQAMIRSLRPGGLLFVDAVPKRYSIQILVDNFLTRKLYRFIKRNPLSPIFEIQMNAKQLKEFFKPFALSDLKVIGNRPFPSLPGRKINKTYLKFVRKLRWFHNRFDGSWLALHLGCGLWVYGFKTVTLKEFNQFHKNE